MKHSCSIITFVLGTACCFVNGFSNAATVQTLGAGSVVTSIDLAATFDSLTSTAVVHLDNYSAPAWSPVTLPLPDGWTPGGGTLALSDPGEAGKPQRFYRLEAR